MKDGEHCFKIEYCAIGRNPCDKQVIISLLYEQTNKNRKVESISYRRAQPPVLNCMQMLESPPQHTQQKQKAIDGITLKNYKKCSKF